MEEAIWNIFSTLHYFTIEPLEEIISCLYSSYIFIPKATSLTCNCDPWGHQGQSNHLPQMPWPWPLRASTSAASGTWSTSAPPLLLLLLSPSATFLISVPSIPSLIPCIVALQPSPLFGGFSCLFCCILASLLVFRFTFPATDYTSLKI